MRRIVSFFLVYILLNMLIVDSLAETMFLPQKIVTIADKAFYENDALDEVFLPYGAESINSLAYAYSGIKKITIPNTVTFIADNAFLGVNGLIIAAPAGSDAAIYAEGHEGIEWENAGNQYEMNSRQTTLDLLDYAENANGTGSLLLADMDFSLLSSEGISDEETLNSIERYNSYQQELEMLVGTYYECLVDFFTTVNTIGPVLENTTFISENGSLEILSDKLSFFLREEDLENLSNDFEVVSLNESGDGILVELLSDGTTYYMQISRSGISLVKGENENSEEIKAMELSANLRHSLVTRGIMTETINALKEYFTDFNTWHNEVIAAIEAALVPVTSIVNILEKELEEPVLQKSGNSVLRGLKKACLATATTAKSLLKGAKSAFKGVKLGATLAGIQTSFTKVERLVEIDDHCHPTDSERLDPDAMELVYSLESYVKWAYGAYVANMTFDLIDVITDAASLFTSIQAALAAGTAAMTAAAGAGVGTAVVKDPRATAVGSAAGAIIGVAGITALKNRIQNLKKYVLQWMKDNVEQIVSSTVATVNYNMAIKTDELLHCSISGKVIDYDSNKGLSKVTVSCGGKSTMTDSSGIYKLEISAGNHSLTFSKNGYETETLNCTVTSNQSIPLNVRLKKLKDDEINGSIVYFGRYEQDNDLTNGTERIQWRILTRNGNFALLLSEYCLDQQPWNSVRKDITWKECTLRNWLNSTFVNSAFNTSEQQAIGIGVVNNKHDQGFPCFGYDDGKEDGEDTYDWVFLLSAAEAKQYLPTWVEDGNMVFGWKSNGAITSRTAYAASLLYNGEAAACSWWLRSRGYDTTIASMEIRYNGEVAHWRMEGEGGVRPALWVNLDAEIFN